MNTPSQRPRVLIAEQHAAARAFIADNLTADEHDVIVAGDTAAAIDQLTGAVNALIVDVNGDTLGLIDQVRAGTVNGVDPMLPILVLTARNETLHVVRLLQRGADDVLVKPYAYPELLARLGALLRRSSARRDAPRLIRTGTLTVDPAAQRAWIGETEIVDLTQKEWTLLLTLAADPDRVITREELMRAVWGYQCAHRSRTLDTHAARLRHKLSGGEQRFVINVWGVGFRLQ